MRVVDPTDMDYIQYASAKFKLPSMRWFWEDRLLLNPVRAWLTIFGNPANFVVDIGPGDGILSFVPVSPGHRAMLFGASWGRWAMGKNSIPARKLAAAAAMSKFNLSVIEGITAAPNRLAQRAMEMSGMSRRGRIIGGLCYSGRRTDGIWYEYTREQAGLPTLD